MAFPLPSRLFEESDAQSKLSGVTRGAQPCPPPSRGLCFRQQPSQSVAGSTGYGGAVVSGWPAGPTVVRSHTPGARVASLSVREHRPPGQGVCFDQRAAERGVYRVCGHRSGTTACPADALGGDGPQACRAVRSQRCLSSPGTGSQPSRFPRWHARGPGSGAPVT